MAKKARSTPPGKAEPETRFLGLPIKGTDRFTLRRHLLILAVLSLVMKWFTTILAQNVFLSFVDLFDITYYLKFALRVFGGQIP